VYIKRLYLGLFLCLFILISLDIAFARNPKKEYMNTNKLINEKSPYLLQHAHNPVDWYPWGEEAFQKAKKENKPIFLSIGYATCHWCHVMEDESFTNVEVADILNKYYISIKVDREERPDIDNIYMSAVMAMTGSGGWPLSVFLTPDRKPFYGGTYYAPQDQFERPGFKTILKSIADSWENRRSEVINSSESLTKMIETMANQESTESGVLTKAILREAYTQFLHRFDPSHGGFGKAPKFPTAHSLSFLLRYWIKEDEKTALEMVETTLNDMANGGIYDHIGWGFHRYSTDAQWRVPHFEKMLYDQALISRAYLEAYQATGKEEFAQNARDTFEYILRDMTHAKGGFYSAEDADSPIPDNPTKKSEGAFYLWSSLEIEDILGKDTAEIFNYYFNVEENGNALHDQFGEFTGKNILYILYTIEETANRYKKSPKEIKNILEDAKQKLFDVRSKRPRPFLDDKILVDWNGLMISSLAFGGRVLNDSRYIKAAEKSAKFLLKELLQEDGKLLHRWRDGQAAIDGTIEDYAFFIHGLLDLYEATFNIEYLKTSKVLAHNMIDLFWDDASGGFFFTATTAERLIVRQKDVYDGAIPSGNSFAALDLIRLSKFTMEKEFEEKANELLRVFSTMISQMPTGYAQMLIALDFVLGPSKEIGISGDINSKEAKEMIKVIYKHFIPNKILAFHPPVDTDNKVVSLIPFLKEQLPLGGKTTVYVCENYTCKLPATSVSKLNALLTE